jgi:hypothetical protein
MITSTCTITTHCKIAFILTEKVLNNCGEQSGTGTGFSDSFGFPTNIITLMLLICSRIIWEMDNEPLSGHSSKDILITT